MCSPSLIFPIRYIHLHICPSLNVPYSRNRTLYLGFEYYKNKVFDISEIFKTTIFFFYSFDETQIREYFPFEHVFESLLEVSSELFGISFEEVASDVPKWHPDVRFFYVVDNNGKHLSSFYLDPYKR